MKTINVNLFKHLGFCLTIFSTCFFTQSGNCQYGKKMYVKQGNMNSFGTYDGVFFKGSTKAGYDCECWNRPATDPLGQEYDTPGTKNKIVSIGKPSGGGQWYVFKSPDCPSLTASPMPAFGPITSAAGCDPSDMFNTHETMTRMVIPFFVDPTISSNTQAWNELCAHAQTLKEHLIVIANPNSGPGASMNTTYNNRINELRGFGAKVVGYVAIGHGSKNPTLINTERNNWYTWYNIDGIFYDESSPDPAHPNIYDEYDNLFQDVQNMVGKPGVTETGEQLVIFNPGVIPPNNSTAWSGHSGLICTFENMESAFSGLQNNLKNLSLEQKERSVILIHGLPASGWSNRYNWLMNEGFNNFYFTSEVFVYIEPENPNNHFPWNYKSPYLSGMVTRTQTIP